MRIAVADWDGFISPVFDTARRVRLVDTDLPADSETLWLELTEADPAKRALRLSEWGVSVLICGAISRPLETMIAAQGIRVEPRVCGSTDEVVRAFREHQAISDAFLMPGCCRRGGGSGGQRRRRRCGFGEKGE